MAFILRSFLICSQCTVATVLLLLAVLASFTPMAAQQTIQRHRSCQLDDETGVCVPREQCKNGKVNIIGDLILQPRFLDASDFDSCNKTAEQCCRISKIKYDLTDSEEVTTTITEEPDDLDWSAQCGQRSDVSEIDKDNKETSRFEFPWSVALFSVKKILNKDRKEFLCGGTLIDDYLVLTAARCVHQQNRSSLVVQLGRWDLDKTKESKIQELAVEELIIHRNYVASSRLRNIAILYLADGATMRRSVNRICLPDHSVPFDTDSLCYVVGWNNRPAGHDTNRQLKIRSTFAVRKECNATIRRATGTLGFQLPKENICPQYLDDPVPCERAPGSGMVCESKTTPGQFFLVGIASYSVRDCDRYQAHDVFVRVKEYISWIDDRVREKNRQTSFYRPDPSSFEES